MSWRSLSASDVQPRLKDAVPALPELPSRVGEGAGRIDLVMFRPIGFFRETEEVLRDGNEDEEDGIEVVSGSKGGMGFDVDDVGRRKARGESDIAASFQARARLSGM